MLLDAVEHPVDVGDRQADGTLAGSTSSVEHGRPPDTDPALTRLAGEEPDRGLDLVGREPTEQLGERRGLGRPGPRRRDRSGGRDQVGEQHRVSVPDQPFGVAGVP